jgi:hypothetical protein
MATAGHSFKDAVLNETPMVISSQLPTVQMVNEAPAPSIAVVEDAVEQ